jgi:glycosyltransferase involved in cell wall biosynthesis
VRLLIDARIGWGHGIGRVIANTVPLIALAHPDWQIDALIEPKDVAVARAAFAHAANITIVPCDVAGFSVAEQTRLQRYAVGHDLTWFTNYWVPLRWRTPFVATVHDMLHLMPDLLPASRSKRLLAGLTFSKVRRDARAVLFVSRFTQQEFTRMVGAPAHGMAISLGGDHLDYPPIRSLRDRTRRLIVVAASKRHKNFALLLDAWRRARVPDHWRLTIVTPDDAMFRSSIDLASLAGAGDDEGSGRIELRRGIDNEELSALYGDSAILLMPSRYEGFGLPLLEGLRAGALCVSSNAGAMIEVAQGAFVSFVNATDGIGWTAAIEQACGLVDNGTIDLDALTAHNAAQAARFRWHDTAQAVAATLQAAANGTIGNDTLRLGIAS